MYVGQGDIGERLAHHFWNSRCIQQRTGQTGRIGYYSYTRVDREADRLDTELALDRKYDGKLCNEVEPPGSGRSDAVQVEETFL